MNSDGEPPATTRGPREVCTVHLSWRGRGRHLLRYEATCRRRLIKHSAAFPDGAGVGAHVQALVALVEELRAEGWEQDSGTGDAGRGVISAYSRPVRRGTP
jgi:hypothetical protein